MDRRAFIASSLAAALAPKSVIAQSTENVRRIGWVTAQTEASLAPYVEAFRAHDSGGGRSPARLAAQIPARSGTWSASGLREPGSAGQVCLSSIGRSALAKCSGWPR